MNLRYRVWPSMKEEQLNMVRGNPQVVMKELGITYQLATSQSIADQWWFWNCENVPDPLPEYLKELNLTPREAIGHGLSKEDCLKLEKNMETKKKPTTGEKE